MPKPVLQLQSLLFLLIIATAAPVSADLNDTPAGAFEMNLGTRYSAMIERAGDVDWAKFFIPEAGDFQISFEVPSGLDFDLELYDASADVKLEGSYSGAGQDETIDYFTANAGWFYIKRYGYADDYSDTDRYYTTVTFTPDDGYIDSIKIQYTENGQAREKIAQAGDSIAIYRDAGTQVDIVIFKEYDAPSPVEYFWADMSNGRSAQQSSSGSWHHFYDVAGALETEVWAGINTNIDVVRINVNNIVVPSYPDLAVSDITVGGDLSPSRPFSVGETVRLRSIVWNIGDEPAGSSRLRYYIGLSPSDLTNAVDSDYVTSLDAEEGDSESVYYTFTSADVGERYFIFRADDNNEIDEASEANNISYWGPFIVEDANVCPSIEITSPSVDIGFSKSYSPVFVVEWNGTDPNDDGTVAISYDPDNDFANGNHIRVGEKLPEDGVTLVGLESVSPGTYYILAEIHDGRCSSYAYAEGRVTIEADSLPPQISIDFPSDGESVKPVVYIQGSAEDTGTGLNNVQISIEYGSSGFYVVPGQGLTETETWLDTEGLESWRLYTGHPGTWEVGQDYTLRAKAVDHSGNPSTTATTFTYETIGYKTPSMISCSVSNPEITVGETLTVFGQISPPPSQSKQAVEIILTPPDGDPTHRTVFTDSDGAFTYPAPDDSDSQCMDITMEGTWMIAVHWEGDADLDAATSDSQTLSVSKAATQTVLETSSQTLQFGSTINISGQMTPLPNCGRDISAYAITITITAPDNSTETIIIPDEQGTMDASGRFTLQDYTGFTQIGGQYQITAGFAGDVAYQGSVSETISVRIVENAGYAILVQGKSPDGEGLNEHNTTTDYVYHVLTQRDLMDADIYYLNYDHGNAERTEIDDLPSISNLEAAITIHARDKIQVDPAPLYIVLVNHGARDGFYLGDTLLTPKDLADWIGTLESSLAESGIVGQKIVVFLGFCHSGSFIDSLSGSGRVIIASSADSEKSRRGTSIEQSGFRHGEYFTAELFREISGGQNLQDCFNKACRRTEIKFREWQHLARRHPYFDASNQHPLLDDNADGLGSNRLEKNQGDGMLAANLFVGSSTQGGNAASPIKKVAPTRFLATGESVAQLWADVAHDGNVSSVWLEIERPYASPQSGYAGQVFLELDEYPLDNREGNRWDFDTDPPNGVWMGIGGFDTPGRYIISYLTSNPTGLISPFVLGMVYKQNPENANPPSAFDLKMPLDGQEGSTTVIFDWEDSVDPDGDPITYTVLISKNPAALDNPYADDAYVIRKELLVSSTCMMNPSDGIEDLETYYWKVQAIDPYGSVQNSSTVRGFITNNANPVVALMNGYIVSSTTYEPVDHATVTVSGITRKTDDTGYYLGEYNLTGGDYDVTVQAGGYGETSRTVYFDVDGEVRQVNFLLAPTRKGDLDGKNGVTLFDAMIAVKALAGVNVTEQLRNDYEISGADVNGDQTIGLEEVIYIFQYVAGMKE